MKVEIDAVAALIQASCARFIKLRQQNISWQLCPSELIAENKWRALRYGLDGKMEEVPVRFLAEELGCLKEVEYIRQIVKNGSSADR